MKIVLLERVPKLGQMGEIVEVRAGYARNFLLPNRKGLRATDENIKFFEGRKAELEAKNLETKAEAISAKDKLEGQYFVLIRSASDAGALYGSVSAKDICLATADKGIKISKVQVSLDKPVKELGVHKINILLHPEVNTHVFINVARTTEEAKIQESGKTIQEKTSPPEKGAPVEIDKLFDDTGMAAKIEEDNDARESSLKIESTPPLEDSTESKN